MNIGAEQYSRGYISGMTKSNKQKFQRTFCEKSVIKGGFMAGLHIATLLCLIGFSFWTFQTFGLGVGSLTLATICVLIVIRQQRALENIVHFGSHNNFARDRTANDIATNLFAAWPMLQDVKHYRVFHQTHHAEYGSEEDPCRTRLEQIGVPIASIKSNFHLFKTILRWFPQYVREYYREVRSSGVQILYFLMWHSTLGICSAFIISIQYAAYQFIVWIVAMAAILPFLRSVAELSEHDYERGGCIASTTYNNVGLLDHLLIHPAGDAWHALHHLYPTVSWWKQRAAHRFLLKHDKAYSEILSRRSLV